ncbi:MAG: NYN domain-containing protein, partial [Odoribacteraceae bacterium]|nr:NYN domain-containing protein [Odoribacteraceae bacterium]
MEQKKQKVIVYVDGFNFYYGLKSRGWRKYYWLDMVKFSEKILRPHQELVEVCYFSARPTDPRKSKRQDAFFQANKLNAKFVLHLGKYLAKTITCKYCRRVYQSFEEKET